MFMKGIEMKKMNPINEFDKHFLLPDNLVLKMIWCPAGTFLMGSPAAEQGRCSDELMHPVTLTRGFWIGQYAVTRGQYRTVIGNGSVGKGIKNLPIDSVSHAEALEFCRLLTFQIANRQDISTAVP